MSNPSTPDDNVARKPPATSEPATISLPPAKLGDPAGGAILSKSPSSPGLPEYFGRYRIIRSIGQGGMGSVYLAHDTLLDRQATLKVPHFASNDPLVRERFYREARAASTIQTRGICPVYDVGAIDGIHYIAMAYIEGQSLARLIKDGRVHNLTWIAGLLRKLAVAMAEAHRLGIIHRDLKPSNVIITPEDEPVIIDFGLARRQSDDDRLTRRGETFGSPAYMSPEQVRGDPTVGPGCDIYSLGVILYELLAGRLPFMGVLGVLLCQIVEQEPEPPSRHRPGIDPRLDAICLKALAKPVAGRYATMADFARALADFLAQEQGISAAPARLPARQGAVSTVAAKPTPTGSAAASAQPKSLEPTFDPGDAASVNAAASLSVPSTAPGTPQDPPARSPESSTALLTSELPPPWPHQVSRRPRWLSHWLVAVAGLLLVLSVVVAALEWMENGTLTAFPRGAVASVRKRIDPTLPRPTSVAQSGTGRVPSSTTPRDPNEDAAATEQVVLRQGQQHIERYELDQAIDRCDAALRANPRSALALALRGQARGYKKDVDRAVADCTAAIQLDPGLAPAYCHRAFAYTYKHEYDRALADCDAALRLDPALPLGYANRAFVHLARKDLPRTFSDCETALRLDPKCSRAFYIRGWAHYLRKDLNPAVADFSKALQVAPRFPQAWNNRGWIHLLLKDFDRAIADLSEAVRLDPSLTEALTNRAQAYLQKGDPDRAIADCTAVIQLQPKLASAYFLRHRAYTAKGDPNRAAADRARAVALDPNLKKGWPTSDPALPIPQGDGDRP